MAAPSTSIALHPRPATPIMPNKSHSLNPLPQLLRTPSGLALLELQGTFNLPPPSSSTTAEAVDSSPVPIGRLDFPDYRPDSIAFDPSSTAWMKRVYMYVGQHQRLTGEVKKLPLAVGIVRRREQGEGEGMEEEKKTTEELDFVEIVKYKIVFSSRPEPVGTG